MTDQPGSAPQYPSAQPSPEQVPYSQPAGTGQPSYNPDYGTGQPAYPGGPSYNQVPAQNPGKTLGVVGFILVLVGNIVVIGSLVGFILSIVGLVKSKKAGFGNGFAVAGIIIWIVGLVLSIIAIIVFFAVLVPAITNDPTFRQAFIEGFCRDYSGPGQSHDYFGIQFTCN